MIGNPAAISLLLIKSANIVQIYVQILNKYCANIGKVKQSCIIKQSYKELSTTPSVPLSVKFHFLELLTQQKKPNSIRLLEFVKLAAGAD